MNPLMERGTLIRLRPPNELVKADQEHFFHIEESRLEIEREYSVAIVLFFFASIFHEV